MRQTGELAFDFADSAMRERWDYERYLNAARDAWMTAHEEAYRNAKKDVIADRERDFVRRQGA